MGAQRAAALSPLTEELIAALSRQPQRELPAHYLYDDLGSELFEAITLLPEYGLTRADARLLQQHAAAILDRLPSRLMVAELGSGSGSKTRWILEALARRQSVEYFPIDISTAALTRCRAELGGIGGVSVTTVEASYLKGLQQVAQDRHSGKRLLVLFLGSSIGNFDRAAAASFLAGARRCLAAGDAVLLGADLEKPAPQMLAAYDDPIGVTAAFNLNLLARLNRELDGDIAIRSFAHQARYNRRHRRIEMHLRSRKDQTITLRAAGFRFHMRRGETIWTEASYKFRAAELGDMAQRAGFHQSAQWVDAEWPFAESLLLAL